MNTNTRNVTLHGITAPIDLWTAFGLHFYSDSDEINTGSMDCRQQAAAKELPRLIMMAQDQLGEVDGIRILRRVATLFSEQKQASTVAELSAALNRYAHGLGKVAQIPANLTVWHRPAGMGEVVKKLADVAETLAGK